MTEKDPYSGRYYYSTEGGLHEGTPIDPERLLEFMGKGWDLYKDDQSYHLVHEESSTNRRLDLSFPRAVGGSFEASIKTGKRNIKRRGGPSVIIPETSEIRFSKGMAMEKRVSIISNLSSFTFLPKSLSGTVQARSDIYSIEIRAKIDFVSYLRRPNL